MTTAARFIHHMAQALDKSEASIEALTVGLRRFAWWRKASPGRGGQALTEEEVAKGVLALLAEGPQHLPDFFLEHANMRVMPVTEKDPVNVAIRNALHLPEKAQLLEYIHRFVMLYARQEASQVLKMLSGFCFDTDYLDDDNGKTAGIELAISGPFPVAEFSFHLSETMVRQLADQDEDRANLREKQEIIFLHQLYGLHYDEEEKGKTSEGFVSAINYLRQTTRRGVKYRRGIDHLVFEAAGKVLRGE